MKINSTFFIFQLLIGDTSLTNVIREQYELSRKANISLEISDNLPDFEREIYVNLLLKDLQDEAEITKRQYSLKN